MPSWRTLSESRERLSLALLVLGLETTAWGWSEIAFVSEADGSGAGSMFSPLLVDPAELPVGANALVSLFEVCFFGFLMPSEAPAGVASTALEEGGIIEELEWLGPAAAVELGLSPFLRFGGASPASPWEGLEGTDAGLTMLVADAGGATSGSGLRGTASRAERMMPFSTEGGRGGPGFGRDEPS